ncbi:hypothetical protein [Parasediminibacterium sp. JCM 36343]|uniref:hypothetical protein n=1 Tax=Parasediminibacterium sp. JCM 36343 TaxID=3374279 RepID=UPI00397CDCE9
MAAVTIISKDKKALRAIKAVATAFDAEVKENKAESTKSSFYFVNGIKITKAIHHQTVGQMAGALTGINLEAEELRHIAWNQNK